MAGPTASKIDNSIRRAVKNIYDSGNLEDLTVKRIRAATEKDLGLPDRWFRDHDEWKDKSAELIKHVVQAYDDPKSSQPAEEVVNSSKAKKNKRPSEATETSEPRKRAKKAEESAPPTKRRGRKPKSVAAADEDEEEVEVESPKAKKKTPAKQATAKKAKKVIVSEDEDEPSSEDVQSSEEVETPVKKRGRKSDASPTIKKKATPKRTPQKKSKTAIDSNEVDEQSEVDAEPPAPAALTDRDSSLDAVANGHAEEESKDEDTEMAQPPAVHEQSESEMSSLIDEEPVKRKKKTKDPEAKKAKPKASKTKETNPKEDEIKKLKDWLKKCGINKRWLELDKMASQKERISYLKRQLADAGMEGRYSLSKAKEIKEARELAEELEEAKMFEQRWGTKTERSRPKSAAEVMADMGVDLDDDSE